MASSVEQDMHEPANNGLKLVSLSTRAVTNDDNAHHSNNLDTIRQAEALLRDRL